MAANKADICLVQLGMGLGHNKRQCDFQIRVGEGVFNKIKQNETIGNSGWCVPLVH